MKITLVDKIRNAKERRWITEGLALDSFEQLEDDGKLYSARLVRKDGTFYWVGWVHRGALKSYAEADRNCNEVYVCETQEREDSEKRRIHSLGSLVGTKLNGTSETSGVHLQRTYTLLDKAMPLVGEHK